MSELDDALRKIDETHAMLREVRDAVVPQVLTVPEVCKRYFARSPRWAQDRPWSLPNYGESDVPGRPRAWSRATCEEWYSVPFTVRESEWFRMRRSA